MEYLGKNKWNYFQCLFLTKIKALIYEKYILISLVGDVAFHYWMYRMSIGEYTQTIGQIQKVNKEWREQGTQLHVL